MKLRMQSNNNQDIVVSDAGCSVYLQATAIAIYHAELEANTQHKSTTATASQLIATPII